MLLSVSKVSYVIYMRYLIILLYFFLFQATGHQFEKNNIIIKHPILKISKNSTKVGAGYFEIFNNLEKEIYLLGIESKISNKQEIHEIIEENNIFKMRALTKGLLIKPGSSIKFKPKSYHIMFFKFNQILKSDQMVDAKLKFNDNFILPIKFKVVTNSSKSHNH